LLRFARNDGTRSEEIVPFKKAKPVFHTNTFKVSLKLRQPMTTTKAFLAFALLFFWITLIYGQSKTEIQYRNKLEIINKQLSQSYINKNVKLMLAHFDKDALSMPEYQPSMRGIGLIEQYYQEIFNRRITISYERKITEIIADKDRITEIGIFTTIFQDKTSGNAPFDLAGKYINVWAVQKDGTLKLKAESYGYFKNITNPANYVVELPKRVEASKRMPSTEKRQSLLFELRAYNTLMEKAIKTRDGNIRADFFTNDAVFMPFADTLKVGMNILRPYLIQYNSYPVTIDSVEVYTADAEDIGGFIIEYPVFGVKWHNGENKGTSSGKGIRIWRREDCYLKIFREIGVHDHIQ
jgi:ketosteroid isomerase-like protein